MIVIRSEVSSDTALRLVQSAVSHAATQGWKVCAVVADTGGRPLALLRMDGVSEPIIDIATDKAFTAATMRRTTVAFHDRMNSDAMRLGFSNRNRLMVWGGGLPLFHEGQCIGGIGVSGTLAEQDIACAEAALAAVGLQSAP